MMYVRLLFNTVIKWKPQIFIDLSKFCEPSWNRRMTITIDLKLNLQKGKGHIRVQTEVIESYIKKSPMLLALDQTMVNSSENYFA